ncbi:Geranylgeranyl transferase type-2 subunit alpha 1 [Sesamum angolense]|uniref:Geranylgeranyl transferase type-2 subunit alpha n=1 Tax=Sesamum angolense TaxID=2727404 RepID=A0AAE2C344_9LAMI|nr:Geranylgeranyl transferase type-2 subunit alpha 1 [Sesamum angolense]
MHGRPRIAPTKEEQEASSVKAAKLRDLQSQVLNFHHNKIYTKEAVEISAKLLESNPEHYTGWNYRKLAVQYLLDQQSENGVDSNSIQSILDEELRIVENALKKNFKSYGAWHHRKWVLSKGHSSTDRELRLLGKFQKLDARNFHAWNYRSKIGKLTLARLLMACNTLISYGNPHDGTEVHYDDVLALYRDLMKMDPAHICYYEDEFSLVLLKQLEPLKTLKSLEALDISYNEIGAHSIDTIRYLCSSPLTHADGNGWNFKKIIDEDVKLKDHWDAYLLFKNLNLRQLEITGNAVVNDRLKAFVCKLMPSLKWLDGEKCC